jgi:hypothetical protein
LYGHRFKDLYADTQDLSSQVRQSPRPLVFNNAEYIVKGCTDLWRLYHVWRGNSHLVIEALHQKYGPVVRIGPNLLDLDLPELAKKIYNIKGDWLKVYSIEPVVESPQC